MAPLSPHRWKYPLREPSDADLAVVQSLYGLALRDTSQDETYRQAVRLPGALLLAAHGAYRQSVIFEDKGPLFTLRALWFDLVDNWPMLDAMAWPDIGSLIEFGALFHSASSEVIHVLRSRVQTVDFDSLDHPFGGDVRELSLLPLDQLRERHRVVAAYDPMAELIGLLDAIMELPLTIRRSAFAALIAASPLSPALRPCTDKLYELWDRTCV